jgi:glycosyltransferase involved in cell wall biosynthesis
MPQMDNGSPDHFSRKTRELHLSLVVPMYNEENAINEFLTRVVPITENVTPNYEIVCVDDGSSDRTLELLKHARNQNCRIKIVSLSRNFGNEKALTAGIDYTCGEAVIPLDADLQDPPELIPNLVAKWCDGFDMVVAVRHDRSSDTFLKRFTAKLFTM